MPRNQQNTCTVADAANRVRSAASTHSNMLTAIATIVGHSAGDELIRSLFRKGKENLNKRDIDRVFKGLAPDKQAEVQSLMDAIARLDGDAQLTDEQKRAEKARLSSLLMTVLSGGTNAPRQARGLQATLAVVDVATQDKYQTWSLHLTPEQRKEFLERRDDITPPILTSALRQFKPEGVTPNGGLSAALGELEAEEREKYAAFYAVLTPAQRDAIRDAQKYIKLPALRSALAGSKVVEPAPVVTPTLNEVALQLTPDLQAKFGSLTRALGNAGRTRLYRLTPTAEQLSQALASESLRVPRQTTIQTLAEDVGTDPEPDTKLNIFLTKLSINQGREFTAIAARLTADDLRRALVLHALTERRSQYRSELSKLSRQERDRLRSLLLYAEPDQESRFNAIKPRLTAEMLRIALEAEFTEPILDSDGKPTGNHRPNQGDVEEFLEALEESVKELPPAYSLDEQVHQILEQLKRAAALNGAPAGKTMQEQAESILSLLERAAATTPVPVQLPSAAAQAQPILDFILDQARQVQANTPTVDTPEAQATKVFEAIMRDLPKKPKEVKPEDALTQFVDGIDNLFGDDEDGKKSTSLNALPEFKTPQRQTENAQTYFVRVAPYVLHWFLALPNIPATSVADLIDELIDEPSNKPASECIRHFQGDVNRWFHNLPEAERAGLSELNLPGPDYVEESPQDYFARETARVTQWLSALPDIPGHLLPGLLMRHDESLQGYIRRYQRDVNRWFHNLPEAERAGLSELSLPCLDYVEEPLQDYIVREAPQVMSWFSKLLGMPDRLLDNLLMLHDESLQDFIACYQQLANEYFKSLPEAERAGLSELKLPEPIYTETEEEFKERLRKARGEFTSRTGVVAAEEQQHFSKRRRWGLR